MLKLSPWKLILLRTKSEVLSTLLSTKMIKWKNKILTDSKLDWSIILFFWKFLRPYWINTETLTKLRKISLNISLERCSNGWKIRLWKKKIVMRNKLADYLLINISLNQEKILEMLTLTSMMMKISSMPWCLLSKLINKKNFFPFTSIFSLSEKKLERG